jgi:ADP-ribose pyrophosphatase YjhB (NUDIX family)
MYTVHDLTKYISSLRNPPSKYKVAVGSLIFTKDNKVILIERGNEARDAVGKLEGVGGKVDDTDDDLHEVLRREIKEEIDIDVDIDDVLTIKIMPGTKYPFWVVVDYLCRLKSGTPKIIEPKKIKSIHTLSLDEIQEDSLSEYEQVAMTAYRKKYGNSVYYE